MSTKTKTYFLAAPDPFEATYNLPVCDSIAVPANIALAFIYRVDGVDSQTIVQEQANLVERLIGSLRSLLREPAEGIHGYPKFLGKLYENPQTHRVSVRVSKLSAVPFTVSYRPEISFAQLRPDSNFPTQCIRKSTFAHKLANPTYPDRSGAYEAFWSQLTFVDGGFVLVTSSHHWLCDGYGIAAFLRLWFERARLGTKAYRTEPECIPSSLAQRIHDISLLHEEKKVEPSDHPELTIQVDRKRSVIPGVALPPWWLFTLAQFVLAICRVLPYIKVALPESQIFTFSVESLEKLKRRVQETSPDEAFDLSVHDMLMAFLWRCVTRARASGSLRESQYSKLLITVNMRSRLTPPLPAAWFGNPSFASVPHMTVQELIAEEGLADVAYCIQASSRKSATDRHYRSSMQLVVNQECILDAYPDLNAFNGPDIISSSYMWYFPDIQCLDLGLGTFQRMRAPDADAMDGLILILPCYGLRDSIDNKIYPGGLEVQIHLNGSTMAKLKADPEFSEYALWQGCT